MVPYSCPGVYPPIDDDSSGGSAQQGPAITAGCVSDDSDEDGTNGPTDTTEPADATEPNTGTESTDTASDTPTPTDTPTLEPCEGVGGTPNSWVAVDTWD